MPLGGIIHHTKNIMDEALEWDSEGLPRCPLCHASMSCESAGSRDTETMGGHDEIEYYSCDKHGQLRLTDRYGFDPSWSWE
jgi:hypothetical protein